MEEESNLPEFDEGLQKREGEYKVMTAPRCYKESAREE